MKRVIILKGLNNFKKTATPKELKISVDTIFRIFCAAVVLKDYLENDQEVSVVY